MIVTDYTTRLSREKQSSPPKDRVAAAFLVTKNIPI
jgi:hypothetical protein